MTSPLTRCACLTAVLTLAAPARADDGLQRAIRQQLAATATEPVTLYRGAGSEKDLSPHSLQLPHSAEDLTRAIGSRLMSSSPKVGGLSSCAHVAGCFALGVRDGTPQSVEIYGAGSGYVGVTRARRISGQDFARLVDRFGTSESSLRLLLQEMGRRKAVVDASQAMTALSERHPGILTRGFQEMIDAALGREAEYLVFGRTPRFDRVVQIKRDDVIERQIGSTHFSSKLAKRLEPPQKTTTTRPVPGQSPEVQSSAKTTRPTATTKTTRSPTRRAAAGRTSRWGRCRGFIKSRILRR